jgi:hypothetical protein
MKRTLLVNAPVVAVPAVETFKRAYLKPLLSAEQENAPTPVIVIDCPEENQCELFVESSSVKTGEVANPPAKL